MALRRVRPFRHPRAPTARPPAPPTGERDFGQWWGRPPIVFFSGAKFDCTGGGQRPAALAREFSRLGYPTLHYSVQEPRFAFSDGVGDVGPEQWDELVGLAKRGRGVAIIGLPRYREEALALAACGWTLIYDCLDDWEAFAAHNPGVQKQLIQQERLLAEEVAACIATAPALIERVTRLGFPEPTLIRNGGPAEPVARTVPPEDMATNGRIRAAYLGHLTGSWFDWDLLEELVGAPDIAVTVIGSLYKLEECIGAGRLAALRSQAAFVDEKPWPQAMRYLGAAHVGIIPFKDREISRAVDPVKFYDYQAAGLWTVHTPEVEELRGRTFCVEGERGHFSEAVRAAAKARHDGAPGRVEVAVSSWQVRAGVLQGIVEGLRPPIRVVPRPEPVPGLHGAQACALRVSVAAPAQCNMQPRCPYCFNGNLAWTDPMWTRPLDEWLEGLLWLSEAFGPLYLSFCYGETCHDRPSIMLMAEVAESVRTDIVTNLLASEDEYLLLPSNGNARLCTSYHPHHWTYDIGAFLEKRARLEAQGLVMGPVMVVGWPPHMPHWADWRKAIEDQGWEWDLIPYRGQHHGRVYPRAYEGMEREAVEEALTITKGRMDLLWEESQGRLCGAGSAYAFVRHDGEIYSCAGIFGARLGSIWERDVKLLPGPEPCPERYCYCHDLWQFVEGP